MAIEGAGRAALTGALAAGLLVLAAPTWAQSGAAGGVDVASPRGSSPIRLTLDLPSDLRSPALRLDLLYIGETFRGFRLIPSDSVRYRGNVNLHLAVDAARAGWWRGGTLFLDLQHGHGKNFELVLDSVSQFLSAIDSPDFTQVYEWGLEQSLAGGILRLRVGKQDTNAIFAVNNLGGAFISPPFTLIPTVPLPTFPAPAVGAALFVEPDERLSVRVGFFDGGPTIGGLGFDTLFDGAGGYFSIVEPVLTTHLGSRALPGTYRLGLWRHSGPFPATDRQGRELRGNHGAFLVADQMLTRQEGNAQQPGIGVFLQLGWAPNDRNPVSRYLGVGVKYGGVVPGRSSDYLALGVGVSRWNLLHPPGAHEEVRNLELFYVVHLTSWARLQPDLQYFEPGSASTGHAWALGLRWLIELQ